MKSIAELLTPTPDGLIQIEIKHCPKHGDYESKKIAEGLFGSAGVFSPCEQCRLERESARADFDKRQAAIERQVEIARNRDNAGLPKRYANITLDTLPRASTKRERMARENGAEVVKSIGTANPRTLAMVGGVGTGKTMTASAIGEDALLSGHRVIYTTAADMYLSIRESFDSKEKSERQVIKRYAETELLIIDEVGRGKCESFEVTRLFQILDHRYCELLPYVICSNISIAEVNSIFGPGLLERARQTGAVIPFDFPSYRKEFNS